MGGAWPVAGAGLVAGAVLVAAATVTTGLTRAGRARERRERTLAVLQRFLDEPMATTRRSAWSFLEREGDDVQHFSHYYRDDPAYHDVDTRNGFADLLRVLLELRTIEDLRMLGELDDRLAGELLAPHRAAWSRYTARMAQRSATHPDAIASGDASLFSWRLDPPADAP